MTKTHRADKQLAELDEQRRKLLHLYYNNQIDNALFTEEQTRLDTETRNAEASKQNAETDLTDTVDTIEKALNIITNWPETHKTATPETLRAYHQAFYKTVAITTDNAKPEPNPRLQALYDAIKTTETQKKNKPSTSNEAEGSYTSLVVGLREHYAHPDITYLFKLLR